MQFRKLWLWSIMALVGSLFFTSSPVWAQETLPVDDEEPAEEASSRDATEEEVTDVETEEDKQARVELERVGKIDQNITDAFRELIEEAKFLGDYKADEQSRRELEKDESGRVIQNEANRMKRLVNEPVFKRPHPVVETITDDQTMRLLQKMALPITGHKYQDLYIRWHLLWVIKEKMPDEYRRESGRYLVRLVERMPDALNIKHRREHYHEPEEHYREYRRLYPHASQYTVTKGYPPFVRRIGPPKSFESLGEAKREEYHRRLREAQEYLESHPYKTVRDEEAIRFNRRIRDLRFAYRQYFGELIYEVLRTGDPAMLNLVINAINNQVRNKDGRAYDLMAYMYLAAFDGVLEKYPSNDLMRASRAVERMARSAERYESYGGQPRNFADYAFHMVYMLKDMYSVSGDVDESMLLEVDDSASESSNTN